MIYARQLFSGFISLPGLFPGVVWTDTIGSRLIAVLIIYLFRLVAQFTSCFFQTAAKWNNPHTDWQNGKCCRYALYEPAVEMLPPEAYFLTRYPVASTLIRRKDRVSISGNATRWIATVR